MKSQSCHAFFEQHGQIGRCACVSPVTLESFVFARSWPMMVMVCNGTILIKHPPSACVRQHSLIHSFLSAESFASIENLIVSVLSATNFSARWDVLEGVNQTVSSYHVSLFEVGGSPAWDNFTTMVNQTAFHDKTPYRNYTFYVAAENEAGIGVAAAQSFTTPAAGKALSMHWYICYASERRDNTPVRL